MWFIGVEVAQETSAPLPKKNPESAPEAEFTFANTSGIVAIGHSGYGPRSLC